jgi:hypothetical protein
MRVALLLLAACHPEIGAAPAGPIAADHLGDGARRIREPDWFGIDMPANPTSNLVPDTTRRGPFKFKQLKLQTPQALFEINYAEFVDVRDRVELMHTLPNRYLNDSSPGMHPGPMREINIANADAVEIAFQLDPHTEKNASDNELVARVQMIWHKFKFIQLQCAAVADQAALCDRFFASFKLE